MKGTIIIPLMLVAGLHSPAISQNPSFPWAKQITGKVVDTWATTTDNDGSIYVTGIFEDSLVLEGNVLYTFSFDPIIGNYDLFISKFNQNGELMWIQQGGALSEARGVDICHDNKGNVYVIGNTLDTLITITNDTILAPGGDALLLLKYRPDGELAWVKQSHGGWSYGEAVTTDEEDNVISVGITISETMFEDIVIEPAIDNTLYVAKHDKEGELLWLRKAEAEFGIDGVTQVTTDHEGNIYLTGSYRKKLVFGNHTVEAVSWNLGGTRDAFIVKYSPTGEALWARTIGGVHNCWGMSVTTDESGNVYLAGFASGTTEIGDLTMDDLKDEMFIVKYDEEGDIVWAKSYGEGGDQRISHIQYANNKLYISGLGIPKINFGDTTIISPYNQVVMVLARLDKDGNPEWITHISDHTTGGIRGFDVRGNELVFCGAFGNKVFIGDSLFVCEESLNSFVGKMVDNGVTNTDEEKGANSPLIEMFPNPFHDQLNINLLSGTPEMVTVKITDLLGNTILLYSTHPNPFFIDDLTSLSPGFYIIHLSAGGDKIAKKIIKQ
ncbi:MAG: T9SS type A sorting domain-containing protein [Saprospiraceae bacterium]|nr:MAG: T9SS type A sorting domain-containing protein [Saprospiraceae bacterium]